MSALLPSDDEMRASFEDTIRKRDPWNVPSFAMTETGRKHASTWLEKEFRSFSSGFIAAWNRRTAPVIDRDADRFSKLAPDNKPVLPAGLTGELPIKTTLEMAREHHAPALPPQEDVARVIEALQPFAKAADRIDHFDGENYDAPLFALAHPEGSLRELLDGLEGKSLTVETLRRARAAILALMGQTGDGGERI